MHDLLVYVYHSALRGRDLRYSWRWDTVYLPSALRCSSLNMALAMLLLLGVAFMPTLANCVDLAVASTEEATMEATPHMGHIDVPHARRTAPPVDVDGVE